MRSQANDTSIAAVVVADHPGQADQSRQQRLQHGPSGQSVAGGQHGQGAEDRGGSLVVASTLQQRIQIRHPAQGGVGDRPLLQRYCTSMDWLVASVPCRWPSGCGLNWAFAVPPAGLEPAAYRLGDGDRSARAFGGVC
jgi:hypothetical protein